MARTPKKQQKPSDQPTQHEQKHLPNDRMDAATVRYYNEKLERELSAKASASGSEAQIWEAFEKSGGNKQALKTARKLMNVDTLKAQAFLIALRDYCVALGLFDQADMFDRLFTGQQTAPAPTDDQGLREANQAGLNAGMNGKNRDTNPWPEGSEAHAKWDAGWHAGQKQIASQMADKDAMKRVTAEGKKAADEGKPQTANPFAQGSDSAAAWNAGWMTGGVDTDAAPAEETSEDAQAPAAVH